MPNVYVYLSKIFENLKKIVKKKKKKKKKMKEKNFKVKYLLTGVKCHRSRIGLWLSVINTALSEEF